MQFTPTIATAILAFCSLASAAPAESYSTTETKTWETKTYTATPASSTSASATATATAAPGLAGLSKTQQVFLSDTRQDALNNVLTKNEDFVFDFVEKQVAKPPGEGGQIVTANRKTFPALTNTGIGGAVAFLGPCGFNTPHVHPRASELAFVAKGRVVSSMFPENGVNNADGSPREILNTVNQFEATIFYQGAVHSQFNPDCEDAAFFAAFNSEDAGVGQVAQELFGTSNEALAAVFGNAIDGADIDKLRDHISPNVALGVEQCLKKCGIAKRK